MKFTNKHGFKVLDNPSGDQLVQMAGGKPAKRYRAVISRNLRDVNTVSAKLLLINVENEDGTEFRDHLWADKRALDSFMPKKNNQRVTVEFTANESAYKTRGPKKSNLVNIRDVRVVG